MQPLIYAYAQDAYRDTELSQMTVQLTQTKTSLSRCIDVLYEVPCSMLLIFCLSVSSPWMVW
jgi:hypothetical protein